jgi:LacI family transcriptional regulator
MGATIKQVAEYAGVSTATVSKFLNGARLKEKNEQAVKEAIEILDYKVNSFARGLRNNKSMTVGILIPELPSLFATQIISEIENFIMGFGYSTIVCDYKSDRGLEKTKLKFLLNKMVDALVIMPLGLTSEDISDINIPVVFIDRPVEGVAADAVFIDNQRSVFEACEYLIENGHRKIGVLCGPADIYTARERFLGYKIAMEKHKISVQKEWVRFGEYQVSSGYSMTEEIVESGITALVATNYELTMGSMIALNELNIHIPEKLSFVGFDNQELATAVKPKLSVVIQPIYEIGEKVAQLLMSRLNNEDFKTQHIELNAALIKMDSVKNISG